MKEIIAQRIAERRRENLDALARDVARAKEWAYRHWEGMVYVDEHTTPSTLLGWLKFSITFPDIDRMVVCPVVYGEGMEIGKAEYRLTWQQGLLYWEGDLTLRRERLGKQGEIRLIVGRAEGKP